MPENRRGVRRARDYGTCPVCGSDVALRLYDGAVMRHRADEGRGQVCRGWIENLRPEDTARAS